MPDAWRAALAALELTPEEDLGLEKALGSRRPYRRGEMVAAADDKRQRVLFLHSGLVGRVAVLDTGERHLLQVHCPGDLLLSESLVGEPTGDELVAVSDATVSGVPLDRFAEWLDRHPRLAALLLVRLEQERLHLLDRLRGLARRSAEARIGRLLLQLHQRLLAADAGMTPVLPGLSQAELGQLVGLSRVHVARVIKVLTDAQIVRWRRGGVEILQMDELRRLAFVSGAAHPFPPPWLTRPSVGLQGAIPKPAD